MAALAVGARFLSVFCTFFAQMEVRRVRMSGETPSNVEKVARPISAISRREVGKVMWKNVINDLLDSEKADLADIRALRRKTNDIEMLRTLGELLERKVERVLELNLLLRYRDRETESKETDSEG